MRSSLLPYLSVTEEPNRYFFQKWNPGVAERAVDRHRRGLSIWSVCCGGWEFRQPTFFAKDLWGSQQEERRLCLPNHLQDISTSLLEGCGGGSTQYNSSTRKATANTEANHWGNEVAVSARPNSASFHCPGLHSSPALSAWIAQLRGMQTMLCCSV